MPHGGVHAEAPVEFGIVDRVQDLILGGGSKRRERKVRKTDIPLGEMTQQQLQAEIAQRDEFGVGAVEPNRFLDRLVATDVRDTQASIATKALEVEAAAADQAYQTVLRSEFTGAPIYERAVGAANNWRIAESLFDEGSATATTQMARVLERMIDPDGVVRPSDLETILERAGLGDRAANVVNAIMSGEQIPAALGVDIFRAVTLVAQDGQQAFNETHKPRYEMLASAAEVDPAQVVHDPFGSIDLEGTLARTPRIAGPPRPITKPPETATDAQIDVMSESKVDAFLRMLDLQKIPEAP